MLRFCITSAQNAVAALDSYPELSSMLTRMRRFPLLVGLSALLAVPAGYAVYWHQGAAAIQSLVAQNISLQRSRGLDVIHAPLAIRGFPGTVTLDLGQVELGAPAEGWRITVPNLLIQVEPWTPLSQTARLDGPVAITTGEIQASLTPRALSASLDLGTDGRARRVTLFGEELDLVVAEPGGASRAIGTLSQLQATLEPALNEPTATDLPPRVATLTAIAQGLRPALAETPPLGAEIARLGLTATLNGRARPDLPPAQALEAWRAEGGVVDLPWLVLDWGALRVSGNGAVTVDEAFRPLGSIALEVAGWREALDALAETGVLDRRSAAAIGLGLALFARAPEGGGAPVITTALRLQDGIAALGPLPLGPLAPILDGGAAPASLPPAGGPARPSRPAAPQPLAPSEHLQTLPAPPPVLSPDWSPPAQQPPSPKD